MVNTSVPKFSFFGGNLKFYHGQQTLSVLFFETAGSLHSLLRKYLPNTQDRITTVPSHLIFHIKKQLVCVTSDSDNCTGAFPGDNCGTRVGSRSALCGLSILSPRKRKRCKLKGQALITICNFHCFVKDHFKWSWLFVCLPSAWGENTIKRCTLVGCSFIHYSFCTIRAGASTVKSHYNLNIFMKMFVILQTRQEALVLWGLHWVPSCDTVLQDRFGSWCWIWGMLTFFLLLLVIFFFHDFSATVVSTPC